jgi:hypothetical protein
MFKIAKVQLAKTSAKSILCRATSGWHVLKLMFTIHACLWGQTLEHIYTSYTHRIHIIYTSLTHHIHIIYTSYTHHIHIIYTSYIYKISKNYLKYYLYTILYDMLNIDIAIFNIQQVRYVSLSLQAADESSWDPRSLDDWRRKTGLR